MYAACIRSTAPHGVLVLAAGASARLGRAKQLSRSTASRCCGVSRAACSRPSRTIASSCSVTTPSASKPRSTACACARCASSTPIPAWPLRSRPASNALDKRCEGALDRADRSAGADAAASASLVDAWRSAPTRAAASAYAGVLGVPALLPRAWFVDSARCAATSARARCCVRARTKSSRSTRPSSRATSIRPSDLARVQAHTRV